LPLNDSVATAARKLAIRFTEDADLPNRFRRQTGNSSKPRKIKEDSEVEKGFRNNVASWVRIIETMMSHIDHPQAWRFINLLPDIDGSITKTTQNNDFCDFMEYVCFRRDAGDCGSDELGGLALLSVALQREIEKRIQA